MFAWLTVTKMIADAIANLIKNIEELDSSGVVLHGIRRSLQLGVCPSNL